MRNSWTISGLCSRLRWSLAESREGIGDLRFIKADNFRDQFRPGGLVWQEMMKQIGKCKKSMTFSHELAGF